MHWQDRRSLVRWQTLLLQFAAVIIGVIAVRNFVVIGALPDTLTGWIYITTTVVGHPFFLATLSLLLVLIPLALLFPERRVIRTLTTAWCVVATLAFIVDSFIYTQYRFHLGGFTFSVIFGELVNLDQVFRFPLKFWLALAGIVGGITLVYLLAGRWLWRRYVELGTPVRPVMTMAFAVALYFAGNFIHAVADARYDRSVTRLAYHLPVHYPLTAKRFFTRTGWIDLKEQRQNIRLDREFRHSTLRYPLNPMQCETRHTDLNILMIVVDAMRQDALTDEASPTLSRLAQESWSFTNHYSGGNITGPGLFSLFYAIPGTYWDAFVAEQQRPVFLELLDDAGYSFSVLSGHSLSRPPFDRTIFSAIEHVTTESYAGSPMQQDQGMTEDFFEFLDSADSPFFSFLFYKTTHGHYLPMPLPKVFTPAAEDLNYLLVSNALDPLPYHNRYLNAVHYVDSQIARVLDELRARDILDNTLVIVTSEHAEEFNDNQLNYWGHGSNFTPAQLHIPLLIRWPDRQPERFDELTTHFDIVPTLVDYLFDCQNPASDYSVGRNLNANRAPFTYGVFSSYFNYAVVEPDRINLSYIDGRFGILDTSFVPLPDATPRRVVMRQALEDMSRFYRR